MGIWIDDRGNRVPTVDRQDARRELTAHGLTSFAQLAERSERELLGIHGVGAKAILRESCA
jgi:hypothetical protein